MFIQPQSLQYLSQYFQTFLCCSISLTGFTKTHKTTSAIREFMSKTHVELLKRKIKYSEGADFLVLI